MPLTHDFQVVLVLSFAVASRYYNWCTDGGTSPRNYGYLSYCNQYDYRLRVYFNRGGSDTPSSSQSYFCLNIRRYLGFSTECMNFALKHNRFLASRDRVISFAVRSFRAVICVRTGYILTFLRRLSHQPCIRSGKTTTRVLGCYQTLDSKHRRTGRQQ
jgi:hypothetical protein